MEIHWSLHAIENHKEKFHGFPSIASKYESTDKKFYRNSALHKNKNGNSQTLITPMNSTYHSNAFY